MGSAALTGCADPCIDDGFSQDECDLEQSGSDSEGSSGSTTAITTSSTTASTSTSTSASGTTSTTAGTETASGGETESDTIIDVTATDTDGTDSGVSASTTSDGTTTGPTEEYCVDGDGDGFGDPNMCAPADPNDPPPGQVPNADDCDDADEDTFPGAAPNDDPNACMTDADDDDYGDDAPAGGVTPGTDCNDALADAWRCALLVTQDGTTDVAYDEQIIDSLQASAFDVTVIADSDATAADADGEDLVVISETALSTDVGGTFRDVAIPVLCMEGLIWDDMDMAPEAQGSNVDFGIIIDDMDPLAGGLTGIVQVVEGQGSGTLHTVPNGNQTDVLLFLLNPARSTVFAFDSGATMENAFVAPARRIGMGYDHDRQGNSTTLMTDDGLALFEAAVTWLMG